MGDKKSAIIYFPLEWSQRLLHLLWRCGASWRHPGERDILFSPAKIRLLLLFGAVNCLMFATPTVVQPSETNRPNMFLSKKTVGIASLSVTNQARSAGPVSGKTEPNKAALQTRNAGQGKPAKPAKKTASTPYSAKTLLAEHPPPLREPKSDLATPLSGPESPESVRLFKRLYYHGKRMDRYQGRQFIAEGEAYHSPGIPEGYFMLFRWYIDCCTGEVEPIGIMVISDLFESSDRTNWIKVDGILEIQMIDGVRVPYLAVTEVKKIPTPLPEKQFISF